MSTHLRRDPPSPDEIRSLFDYDSSTGKFRRLKSNNGHYEAGSLHKHGYIYIEISGRSYVAHHLAWVYVHREWPDRPVEHINGIRSDNRINNLRLSPGTFSHEELTKAILYDPQTGAFQWRTIGSGRLPTLAAGDHNGYIRIGFGGERYYAHRLAWFYMTGKWPPHEIDHVNLNRHDNRWENLRLATRSENAKNGPMRARNKSGYKGVSAAGKQWAAWIMHNRQRHYLGLHPTPEAAAEAYRRAADELHGKFANHG